MKTILCLAVLVVGTLGLCAQDQKGGTVLVESQAVKKEEKKVPVTPAKPTNQILGKKVIYGGYFTEFARAERKRPLFDLKAPPDPQKDSENAVVYPGKETVSGLIFFSIKF